MYIRTSASNRPAVCGAPWTIRYRPTWSKSLHRPSGKRPQAEFSSSRGVSMEYPATATIRAFWNRSRPSADVVHPGGAAGALVDGDPGHHRVGAHLGAVRQRVGDVGDQRGRLGVHLAALQAEAAVDAVRAVPEPAVGDRDRADLGGDPEPGRAAQEHLAVPADRVRPVRVAVRVSPRPALAGDREFLLDRLVVRAELGIADRPVGADAVQGGGHEVARVEPRGVAGVVDHRSADAAAGVVRAHRDRVRAGDHPRVGPVQVVRARLVTDPVGVGVPERPGVQRRHRPAGPGQPLGQDRAARAAAHDHQVDLVVIGELAHVPAEPVVRPGAVVRQQPGRLVAGTHPVLGGHHASFRTGSSAGRASRTSNGSSLSTPAFL